MALEPSFLESARAANVTFGRGDFEASRETYERSLVAHPDDPDTLNSLGQTLVRLGRLAEAVSRFEQAVTLSPATWAYRFNLAHAAAQLRNWDRAIAEYREAKRLFPEDYATTFNLAMALHKKGDEIAAIDEYRTAIQLAPGEPAFHVSLGVSLEAAGRIPDAVAEFQRYLELDPAAPDAAKVKEHLDALLAADQPPRSVPSSPPPPQP